MTMVLSLRLFDSSKQNSVKIIKNRILGFKINLVEQKSNFCSILNGNWGKFRDLSFHCSFKYFLKKQNFTHTQKADLKRIQRKLMLKPIVERQQIRSFSTAFSITTFRTCYVKPNRTVSGVDPLKNISSKNKRSQKPPCYRLSKAVKCWKPALVITHMQRLYPGFF